MNRDVEGIAYLLGVAIVFQSVLYPFVKSLSQITEYYLRLLPSHEHKTETVAAMPSISNNMSDNTASLPTYSTSATPPAYASSDAYSVTSIRSMSKSIMIKIFQRKCRSSVVRIR